jgi:mono/diheme cytochrome c family protein
MTRRLRTIIGAGVLVFLMLQLVPMSKQNSPITQDVAAPPQVEAILRRACYDCHSYETRWPWYAHIAPVSWLVVRDVKRGRNHLNFSAWDKYSDDPETVIRKLRNIDRVMHNGTMPLWYYLPEHAPARLSDADRQVIEDWVMQSVESEEKREGTQP